AGRDHRHAMGAADEFAAEHGAVITDAVALRRERADVEDSHASTAATLWLIAAQSYSASHPCLGPRGSPARSSIVAIPCASAAPSGSHTRPRLPALSTRCWARLSGAEVVMTRVPQASASRTAIPNPSRSDGNTATGAAFR